MKKKKQTEQEIPPRDEIDAGLVFYSKQLHRWSTAACIGAVVLAVCCVGLAGAFLAGDALNTVAAFDRFSIAFWCVAGILAFVFLVFFSFISMHWLDWNAWSEEHDEKEDEQLWADVIGEDGDEEE